MPTITLRVCCWSGAGGIKLYLFPCHLWFIVLVIAAECFILCWLVFYVRDEWDHGEIMYGDTSWIEDNWPDTFSEFIFPFPPCRCSVCWSLIDWQCWNIKCWDKFFFLSWIGLVNVVHLWYHAFINDWFSFIDYLCTNSYC